MTLEETAPNKMGTQKALPLLISMALPAILSMMVQSIYNIVDSYFVARISEEALRAVSIIFPVQQVMIALSAGTGVGVNSYLSRSLGRRDLQAAQSTATHGFVLATVLWLVFAGVGFVTSSFYMTLFTQELTVIEMGSAYMRIVTVFSCGVFWEIMLEKTLQATGSMVLPMVLQMIGAIGNCILDPLFIFGFAGLEGMGVAGAAIATVLSQILAFVCGVIWLRMKPPAIALHLSLRAFHLDRSILKGILGVGLPSIVMMCVSAFLVMMLNTLLRAFSESAISVLGIYIKLQSFVMMPIFGLGQGLLPIVGYNYGARNPKRIAAVMRYALCLSCSFMTLGCVVFQLFPAELIRIFDATDSLLALGIPALRINSWSFLPVSLSLIAVILFQGLGLGKRALLISLLRQLIFLLPIAWAGSRWIGIEGVWIAFPIAELLDLLVTFFLLREPIQTLKGMAHAREREERLHSGSYPSGG